MEGHRLRIDHLLVGIAEELGIDIVIHLDPISTDEAKTAQVRAEIEACVAGMDPDVRIENFRIARLGERTVVIFELERTPRISDPDFKRVRKAFQDRIESCLPRYQVFIDRYGEPH